MLSLKKQFRLWKQKLVAYLKLGLSPNKFASALAMGSIIGFFPVLGTTTIINAALAAVFKLNMALVQIANYAVYPLQILLIVPEIKLAHQLFFSHKPLLKLNSFIQQITQFDWNFIKIFGDYILMSIVGWLVISIPVFIFVFFGARIVAKLYEKKKIKSDK